MVPRLLAEHDLASAELDALQEKLNGDNRRLTGRADDRGLVVTLRDEAGRAVGIAAGYSWAGIAELKLMWVDEAYRGRGHGRKLLDAFVAEAAARGSRRIWVSTHDFQARPTFMRRLVSSEWPNSRDGPKAIRILFFARR
ncbi:GNAT family N-acetyltransferase [Mesorhizobium sp. MSK_1335]|uniref:GNAT family N-acetyltransferase n=1 Tax=Mesorhizobium montanum TaxID=3072323 RepID=A0ABU4ZSX7_9HYPH|nr:GNAT family N-acetyltransferase [Mesorhizobium sp. MSK_1335]MDX8527547.1 GNAT family N-acetyltransferase [Mesorhizobium sp. MSK_1335]